MLSNRKLEEQIARIKWLQQLQNDNDSGNLFPDDEQIAAHKINDEIGSLAYAIYEQIKNDPSRALEAAAYFALALDEHRRPNPAFTMAVDIFNNHNIPLDTPALMNGASPTMAFHQGLCYLLGLGDHTQDLEKAFACIKSAAERHLASAQYNLANFINVKDEKSVRQGKEVYSWLLRAAQQGHKKAQTMLGHGHRFGDLPNLPRNVEESVKWYTLAARRGDNSAQYELITCFEKEKGVSIDDALRWAKLLAPHGHPYIEYSLGKLYLISNDRARASRWFKLAAEHGQKEAGDTLLNDASLKDTYHAIMWHKDETAIIEKIKRLIQGDNHTFTLLFDIHRSATNAELFKTVVNIVSRLKSLGVNTVYFELAIKIVTAKRASIPFENSASDTSFAIDLSNTMSANMFLTACAIGMIDFVDAMLQRGINQDITHHSSAGWTALKYACEHGHYDIAELLLKHKANPNLFDDANKWTPLHNAAHRGRSSIVKLLLKHGAHVDARTTLNSTPLLLAANAGYASIVKILLAHGADPTMQDSAKKTALIYAADTRNMACFLLLLNTGKFALPQALAEVDGSAHERLKSDFFEYLKTLPVNERIALCDQALDTNTPIGKVIAPTSGFLSKNKEYKTLQAIKAEALAIKQKANRDKKKQNPLHEAIKLNDLALMKYWLRNGANVHGNPDDDKTPIVLAAHYGFLDGMNLLIASGASYQYQHIGDTSPLHAAARAGKTECVRRLLQLGAEIDLIDKFGQTPLDAAEACRQHAVVDLMLEYVSGNKNQLHPQVESDVSGSKNQLYPQVESDVLGVPLQEVTPFAPPLTSPEQPQEQDVFALLFNRKQRAPSVETSVDHYACLFANSKTAHTVSDEHKTKLANIASLSLFAEPVITKDKRSEEQRSEEQRSEEQPSEQERTEAQLTLLEGLTVPTRKLTQANTEETHDANKTAPRILG